MSNMNLAELFSKYDFHDSCLEYFEYSLTERKVRCSFELGDWNSVKKCDIEFINVTEFHILADNADFKDNELIDHSISSNDTEYFKGFFNEGCGKAGKLIEIKCEYISVYTC